MILYLVLITVVFIYFIQELLRKKYKINEISKKNKELLEKFKETQDENILKEILSNQKIFVQYFLISTLVIIILIFSIISLSKPPFTIIDNSTIKVPKLYKNQEIAVYYQKNLLGIYKTDQNGLLKIDKEIALEKDKVSLEVVLIKLTFKLPIFNKNWLSTFGSYIIIYTFLSILIGILKRIYKFIHKTRT